MKNSNIKFLAIAMAMLITLSSFALGQQDYGSINGTVTDPNGAVVAGATVKAVRTATSVSKTTTTNSDGYYYFPAMLPGEYSITVNAGSFKDFTTKGQVSVSGTKTVDIKLGISVNINVVDVSTGTGGVAEINTTDQQQSVVINQKQLANLPIQDRNPYALAGTAANVSAGVEGRGVGVSINGQRDASTEILLDGTENVAVFTATVAQTVPADSVSEFRLTTSNFSAEYGRASGGIVNVVTRGGGNKLEGSAFIQNRNSGFGANTFDNNANGIPRGIFNRNQFGYSVTGPIKQNKLFFSNFGEWLRVRSSDTTIAYVPNATFIAAMAPNARAIFAANTLTATPVSGAPIVTSGCTLCQYQRVSYLAPIDAGGGTPQNTWNNVSRVDWAINNNTSAYFSFKMFNNFNLQGSGATSPYQGYGFSTTQRGKNFQGSFVHSFSSNFLIDLKIGYNSLRDGSATGDRNPASPTLYALQNGTATLNNQRLAYPGYLPFNPGTGLPITGVQNVLDIKPNATWIKGDHNVRFGGQFVHIKDPVNFPAYQNASENLSNSVPNASLALIGGTNGCAVGTACVQLFQVAVTPGGQFPGGTITLPATSPNFTRTNLYTEWALYGNDNWKVSRTLTLNLGLRYEYYGPQHSKEGLDSNFFFGAGANIYQRIRNGRLQKTGNSGVWKADKNNWAPRIGFAWDVTGDGKTSLRGGYGIAFERNFGNVTFNVIQNPPNYAVLGTNSTAAAPIPVSLNNLGPLAGSSGTRILPRVTLRAVDPDIVNAYSHQWGFSLEREVARQTVAKLEYSGSAGRNLYSISNINRAGSGTALLKSNAISGTDCPATLTSTNRLNCNYGNINFRGSDGVSNYYSYTGTLESNNLLHTGMFVTAHYTYSHAKDDLSSTFSGGQGGNFGLGYLDPFNPRLDYGDADFDVRHRFVATAVYPIRFKLDNNMVANAIFGGWTVSGILNIQSGNPFSIFDCTNAFSVCMRYQTGGSTLQFNGKSVISGPNTYNYINLNGVTPSSFVDAGGATDFGPFPSDMSARNSFRGPGSWNADMSLFKDIRLTERYKLQIRADAINVFNHANLGINGASAEVNNTVDPAGINRGVLAFKNGNRRVQLFARFSF